MHRSPSDILEQYLEIHQITPQKFAHISGMPETEVRGLLDGRLPFSALRAHHLAAVFNTSPTLWLYEQKEKYAQVNPTGSPHSLV